MGNRCRCGRGHGCACGHSTVQVISPPNLIEGLYEWAIKEGLFVGTMAEFIEFMKGPQGDSIYEWAVKNGLTTLPKEEWYAQFMSKLSYSEDTWT